MIFHFEIGEAWSCDNFLVSASSLEKAQEKVKAYLEKNYNKRDAARLLKKLQLANSTNDVVHIGQSFD